MLDLIKGKKYYTWLGDKPKKFTDKDISVYLFTLNNRYYCGHVNETWDYSFKVYGYTGIEEINPDERFLELKKAHSEKQIIQYYHEIMRRWYDVHNPLWNEDTLYRIKPKDEKSSDYRTYTA